MSEPTADIDGAPDAPDGADGADDADDARVLDGLAADVQWTDRAAGAATADALPPTLGRLVDLADWLGSVQSSTPPHSPRRVRLVRIPGPDAADAAAASASAGESGVGVRVVDGLPADVPEAVRAGVAAADREVDEGADLLVLACPGTELAAAVAISALTGAEPVRVLARGAAATDPRAWMRRAEQVRDRRREVIRLSTDADALLAALGDPVLAAAAGLVLQAAVRQTPVLLDGTGSAAAALVAYQAQTRVVRWLAVAGTSADPAYTLVVTTMGLRPVLDLGVDTGDGTAALLALPALLSAARLASELIPAARPDADGGADAESEEPADDA